MTAAEMCSFAVVPLGWILFRAIYRRAVTRDMHNVSPDYLRELSRKVDDDRV